MSDQFLVRQQTPLSQTGQGSCCHGTRVLTGSDRFVTNDLWGQRLIDILNIPDKSRQEQKSLFK